MRRAGGVADVVWKSGGWWIDGGRRSDVGPRQHLHRQMLNADTKRSDLGMAVRCLSKPQAISTVWEVTHTHWKHSKECSDIDTRLWDFPYAVHAIATLGLKCRRRDPLSKQALKPGLRLRLRKRRAPLTATLSCNVSTQSMAFSPEIGQHRDCFIRRAGHSLFFSSWRYPPQLG